nr:DUF1345 domain-containing protein [Psychromicrobium silvestre]
MLLVALFVGCLTGFLDSWIHAPAVAWAGAAGVYNLWVWLAISRMDASATAAHATEEDPRRPTAYLLVTLCALASLAAVAIVVIDAKNAGNGGRLILAALALGTTALSWLMVHTLYTLRYAEIYYTNTPEPGGIDFNQEEPPQYTDFAYMAFSLGMTYQVSDTSIQTRTMRSAALRHSLLAFVFGTGILATTINLVVSLAS